MKLQGIEQTLSGTFTYTDTEITLTIIVAGMEQEMPAWGYSFNTDKTVLTMRGTEYIKK